jgi:hypothetical protein
VAVEEPGVWSSVRALPVLPAVATAPLPHRAIRCRQHSSLT